MNLPVKTTSSLLMDPESFNHMQRVGSMLALSPLFPEHLRKGSKDIAIANGVLVMNMAARLNEDPLTVAQNIYFVSGKPGWSSSYMIGKANQHGVFKNPISWEIKGKGESLSVTAFGELSSTGKRVEVTCDMAMAKAEGWTKNSKYQSMPEQMLRYRSATFLIRLYCPEVMVGVPAQVEIELGMKDVTPDDYADTERPARSLRNPNRRMLNWSRMKKRPASRNRLLKKKPSRNRSRSKKSLPRQRPQISQRRSRTTSPRTNQTQSSSVASLIALSLTCVTASLSMK